MLQILELGEGATTIFAIAPEPSPAHPVVTRFQQSLHTIAEPFAVERFHYSDRAFYEFLYSSEKEGAGSTGAGRRLVMIYGLDQLPTDRLVREMDQLNRGRETIAKRNLVLIFWLNKADFLDEFRSRAPDFWDWRGKVITFQTRPPLHPLLYPYLEWLIAENSYLKMGGIMQVNRQVDIFLDQIYVSLKAEWVEERSQSVREQVVAGVGRVRSSLPSPSKLGEPDEPEMQFRDEPILEMSAALSSPKRVTKTVDLAEAVRKYDYGVILGDPGAGKTTLLRYLVRHFAIASRDRTATVTGGMQEDLGQTRLPILFRIADYAERLAKQPSLSLVEYLKQFYRQWEQRYSEPLDGEAVATLLLNKMAAGDCLLLLDGLDEVFDQANRVQVVQQISQLVDAYPGNQFVITSRIAGYQEAALGRRFREFTITAMGEAQIEQFLQRWCLAIEMAQRPEADADVQKRDAEREAQGIMQAIATQPGVKRFAANPLLLTILALIHRNGTQMPQRRVELYDLATKTLIEDWQLGRNIPYGTRQRQLALVEEEVTALLAPLAFQMHEEKPSGLVEQAQVEAWLTPRMAELQGVDEPTALDLVRQFLRKVRETTGLFVERAPGVYGFMHLTFEEYFAARHIADNDIDTILTIISPYRNQARWNEPILLALGYLSANPNQINRLVEKLFSSLETYQPCILNQEIRLKNASSPAPLLVWYSQADDAAQESETVWQDLLFVGQVLAEVKVKPRFCQRQVEKLILTYLGLDTDYEDEPTQQLLRLLRGIETFNHQVLEQLQQAIEDETLSEEQHNRAWTALLYVVCGEAGETLIEQVTQMVDRLTPALFDEIRDLVAELGAEMTPALERSREDINSSTEHRQALEFITGLSYLRSDNYDRVIAQLEPLLDQVDCELDGYIRWVIAIAHENKENYDQGLQYYQQCSEKLQSFILWRNWGVCYRSHKQYEQSLECLQQALAIARQVNDCKAEANILWNIGRSYQGWGKYEEAIAHYQQSRDRYQQLEKESNVANQWYWMADCYREWGKYALALEAEQQDLALRQKLDDQSRIALAYYQLGYIYQAWGKYEEAIAHYQQSRDRYQQLEKETNVANLWLWLGDCYETWGKYTEAIACYQQSRDRYETLDLQQGVANLLSWLASCYRESKDYATAIDYYQCSIERHQAIGNNEITARRFRQLSKTQRLWAKNSSSDEAIALLQQAKHNLQQAIDLDTAGDYRENLAYDQIALALLAAEDLRGLPATEDAISEQITHFEQSYTNGFALFSELGQVVDSAEGSLEIARAYLEIPALADLDQAEALARQSLQTFQAFNRRKLEAAADKLLGEIYLQQAAFGQAEAATRAQQFLTDSLRLYRELTLTQQAEEVAQLSDP